MNSLMESKKLSSSSILAPNISKAPSLSGILLSSY